ncbi:hypothetical protein [Nocardia cyriacigeorgica]|uniref:hypothetical protein n=1 Tax=Nocardia cyriacigeorgica TaxID=135487 RepID=UPI0035121132
MTDRQSPLEFAAALAADALDALAEGVARHTGPATIPVLLIAGLLAGAVFWWLGTITRH